MPHRLQFLRNPYIGIGALAFLVALISLTLANVAFHFRPITTDENSYLFQAQNFLNFKIARPAPPAEGAFDHPMIIIDEEAGWLSRYPPAHPLWLLPGVLIGWPLVMSVVGAACGVILLSTCGRKLGISPLIPAVLVLLCPFYLFMYGTLLSHTSAFLCVAGMLLCYMQWQQSGHARYALMSGIFWGFLFMNRTYTATLIALPFALDAVMQFLRGKPRDWKGTSLFAGTSLVFALIFRGYNKLAVGSSRASTFLFYDRSEGLGFGPRHTAGLPVDHSLERGIQNTWENLGQLDQWLFGIQGGLLMVLLLAIIGWHKRWTPLLVLAPLCLWAGYVYFWFPGIEHFRPVYSFETLPFLLLAAGLGLHRLFTKFPAYQTWIAISLILIVLPFSIHFSIQKIADFSQRNQPHALLAQTLRSLPEKSLVILEVMDRDQRDENILNLQGLQSDPLVVRSNGINNSYLAHLFPERNLYLVTGNSPEAKPYPVDLNEPLKIPIQRLHFQTGRNEQDSSGSPRRSVNPEHSAGLLGYGGYFTLPPGEWELQVPVMLKEVDAEKPLLLEIVANRGQDILVQQTVSGSQPKQTVRLSFQNNFTIEIEPRFQYGGSGKGHLYDSTLHKR